VDHVTSSNQVAGLLVEHQVYLRKTAFFLVRSTPLDADDLLQRANELVLRNAHQWKGFAFRKWAHKILFNEYLAQKKQAKEKWAIDLDDDAWATIEDPEASRATHAVVESLFFMSIMERLAPEHREVLMLISIEGYSYEEAAQILGIPEGTVTSRLKRAKRRYEELLQKLQQETEVMA